MRDRPWSVFFDVNISFRLCNMILAMEEGQYPVVHAKDHPQLRAGNNREGNSTPDVEWIKILSQDEADWVALSGDIHIIDTPQEREVLKNSGLTFFAFDDYFANTGKYGQALQLVEMWPEIIKTIKACDSGVFVVRMRNKKIEEVAEGSNSTRRRT